MGFLHLKYLRSERTPCAPAVIEADNRRAIERPRRRTRDARPQTKYTAAAVRSSGGLYAGRTGISVEQLLYPVEQTIEALAALLPRSEESSDLLSPGLFFFHLTKVLRHLFFDALDLNPLVRRQLV